MELKIFLLCIVAFTSGEWVKEMENSGMYEGDIVLTPDQVAEAKSGNLGYASTKTRHWPKTIYYDWDTSLANNRGILQAIADYHKYTCLRFYHKSKAPAGQKDYIYFYKGGGCSSGVGYSRNSGQHRVSIGNGCASKGAVMHEIAHRLGVYHEQSRPDRDNYITVKFENIRSGREHNFNKQQASNIDYFGTKYDYLSVMHYGAFAFSKNYNPTIVTKDASKQYLIGRKGGFSDIDKIQMNRMYKCGNIGTVTTTTVAPAGSFSLQHTGGRCLSVDNNNYLVFTSSCSTKFKFENGQLILAGTNRCLRSDGRNDNAYVMVSTTNCDRFSMTASESSGYFAIKHDSTGKCMHPKGGSSRPPENNKSVIYNSCNESRLKFKKV